MNEYTYGWSWGDLAGELWARGIDIDEVSHGEIERVLGCHRPEDAARMIEKAAGENSERG